MASTAAPADPDVLAALATVPTTVSWVRWMLPSVVLFELLDTVVARLRRKHRLD